MSGRRLKLNYITQAKARPPSFVLFCSRADAVPESYLRYLVNSAARGVRSARHADPHHAAREGQPVRRTSASARHERTRRREAPRRRRQAAPRVVFIFITVLLDMLAIGIIIPVLPTLVGSFLDGDTAGTARDARPVRHRLGADAVPVLADARRAIGPLRPAAGDPALQFRALGSTIS